MNTPQSEPAQRLAALYRRRPATPWSPREIRVFQQLQKAHCFDTREDLALIERYYASERKKAKGIHRRDLATLLNNWQGELDRARTWEEKYPGKTAGVVSRCEPARWQEFLESHYPAALVKEWHRVSGDVKSEFREWEKQ